MINIFFTKQQVLFHLSQFTPRRNNLPFKKQKHKNPVKQAISGNGITGESAIANDIVTLTQSDIELCKISLLESLDKFKISPNASILNLTIESIIQKEYPFFVKKYNSLLKDDRSSPWKISYTSKNSFRENKEENIQTTNSSNPAFTIWKNFLTANQRGNG